jgi:hypothetical protein
MADAPYKISLGFVQSVLIPRLGEIIQIMPESIVLGTSIMGILTSSLPILIFLLFQFEVIGIRRLLSMFSNATFPTLTQKVASCDPGFLLPGTNEKICIMNIFGKGGSFPSSILFFVSAVFTYLLGSVMAFQNVLTNLGSDYSSRIITATSFSLISIIIVFLYNIVWGCNSFIGSMGSVLLGIMFATLLFVIHSGLFGKEGINLMGVPLLDTNKKMFYVCGKTS